MTAASMKSRECRHLQTAQHIKVVSTFWSILDIETQEHVGKCRQLSLGSMQQQLHDQLSSGVPTLAGKVERFSYGKAWAVQTAVKGSCKTRSDVHIPGFTWMQTF
jgi:hypothetical protein